MILCFLFAALIVALDQFFKQWVVRAIDLGATGPEIIPGVLGLTHWENDGAMLNILSGQQWLLAGIALAASIALVMILLRYNEGFWGTIGLTAVLGGTVGNLMDRIFNDGKVIDMFRTLFINFPIFNIADIFITLGFITFLIHFIALTFKVSKEEEAKSKAVSRASRASVPYDDDATAIDIRDIRSGDDASLLTSQSADVQPIAQVSPTAPTMPAEIPAAPAPIPTAAAAPPVAPVAPAPPVAPVGDPYGALTNDYDPTTDTTPDISFTMEALEAEFGSLDVDDYDVDDLLREYGIEDDDITV